MYFRTSVAYRYASRSVTLQTISTATMSSTAITISVAEEMNPSRRNTMEDCHVVHTPGTWKCPDPHMTYLAVYDGHGGRDIVNFLEESLADNVARELAHDEDDASIDTRLERAFLVTDIQSRHMGLVTSGATVAVCLVSKSPNGTIQIHAANAGDARIVLADRRGDAHRLTHDHRADDPQEVARINAAGGFVWKNRVVGILAVARSLGDHGMKEFVIAQPHVHSWNKKADFVIVACDGLWDVLSDQEAVDLVYQWKEYKTDVADFLCKEAMARGSADNITVIVSWLQ